MVSENLVQMPPVLYCLLSLKEGIKDKKKRKYKHCVGRVVVNKTFFFGGGGEDLCGALYEKGDTARRY